MELMLFGWLLFGFLIGAWASAWGRSFAGWMAMALLLSPLIAGVVLLICGRTAVSMAQRMEAVDRHRAAIRAQ